jgi:hypothetical protein
LVGCGDHSALAFLIAVWSAIKTIIHLRTCSVVASEPNKSLTIPAEDFSYDRHIS